MLPRVAATKNECISHSVVHCAKQQTSIIFIIFSFHTQAPILVYQMIDENLQVAQTISAELVNKVLLLSMEEVARFGKMYKASIFDYKERYFKDRGAVSEQSESE